MEQKENTSRSSMMMHVFLAPALMVGKTEMSGIEEWNLTNSLGWSESNSLVPWPPPG